MVLWAFAIYWFGSIALNRLLAGTGTIVGSFFWLAGTAVCVLFAVRSVRRARGFSPGKTRRRYISFTGEPTVAPRWARPLAALAGGLFLVLLGLVFVLFSFLSRASIAESSYTQAHGVRENATVTEIDNARDCGPDGCPLSSMWVTLDKPVAGHTDATMSMQEAFPYTKGQSIAVLVDPKDPGHAELPGRPANPGGGAPAWMAAAVVLALGCALIIRPVWMRWRTGTWIVGWPFR